MLLLGITVSCECTWIWSGWPAVKSMCLALGTHVSWWLVSASRSLIYFTFTWWPVWFAGSCLFLQHTWNLWNKARFISAPWLQSPVANQSTQYPSYHPLMNVGSTWQRGSTSSSWYVYKDWFAIWPGGWIWGQRETGNIYSWLWKKYIFQQKTKPYTFSSSRVTTSKHLNFKIISLKYLNQYGFSQKSICSYKYDCLIIHKPWASRLEKISVAEGTEVVFHLR